MERSEMRDRLEEMLSFAAVARTLSFADAARELGIDASTLSRRIARLERALGTALLRRTTRRVSLTEAGALYLERCTDVLTRVEEADALVSGLGGDPRGRLRVALPNLFGQLQVAPLLPEFMHRHPGIELELSFMDRYVDLVHEGFDVAIRIGTLTDSSLVARRLATNRRVLCASPRYLRGRRPLTKPEDLAHQACLHFSFFADGETWTLQRGEERVAVRVRPVLRSDNAEALRLAAVGGCGIAFLATFLVGEDCALAGSSGCSTAGRCQMPESSPSILRAVWCPRRCGPSSLFSPSASREHPPGNVRRSDPRRGIGARPERQPG